MAASIVRISKTAHQVLKDLARQSGQSMQAILDQALEDLRRKRFLDECNAAYAALRDDPKAWAEVEAERRQLAGTLMDGLDAKERWSEDGRVITESSRPKRKKAR